MKKVTDISSRKSEHIKVNLEKDVHSGITNGLELFSFDHEALPEIDLSQIDTSVDIFGKLLDTPLLISSMTGGTEEAITINRNLAMAAEERKIALGLGSQRAALEDPKLATSYKVREFAPNTLLFANLGAIQLNYGVSIEDCKRIVEMIQADGLILHLNPLQEAIQKGGNVNFKDLSIKINAVCMNVDFPVIVKEVGWGISKRTARIISECGVSAIDVAGAGGTSWSQVEMHAAKELSRKNLASLFREWGISTAESIRNVKEISPEMPIIASGGLYNGLDMAKCYGLGAKLAGAAGLFLRSATRGVDEVIEVIDQLRDQIRTIMFATGSSKIIDLIGKLVLKNNIDNG